MQTNVAIYTNDPVSPMRLQMRVEVKPVLKVEPMYIDLGQITSGDTQDGEFTIATEVLDPFLLELDESRVTDPMKVQLSPVDPDADGKSQTWKLAFTLGPEIPEGHRNYNLRLITDIPRAAVAHEGETEEEHAAHAQPAGFRELNCAVRANVRGLVVATPNFVSMGLVRPGQVEERTVKIESLDPNFQLPTEADYEIVSLNGAPFEMAEFFTVKTEPVEGTAGTQQTLTVRLEGLPEDFQKSFGGMIKLRIDHPTKETLNVRFSGVVRAGIPTTSGSNPGGSGG